MQDKVAIQKIWEYQQSTYQIPEQLQWVVFQGPFNGDGTGILIDCKIVWDGIEVGDLVFYVVL